MPLFFLLKFPKFRYNGNRGRPNVTFNDTSQLPDLETPCSVQMSYISRIKANFVLKFPHFRYRGNRGCLMYISTTPLN